MRFCRRGKHIVQDDEWYDHQCCCKQCYLKYRRGYYHRNKKKAREQIQRWLDGRGKGYHKQRWIEHKEKYAAYAKQWREDNAEYWKQYNKDHVKKWRLKNPGRAAAISAKRRYAKIKRTPPWITEAMLKEMEALYIKASKMATPHQVDHIIPLQGKLVSGLHVPWNLRIIPAKQNWKKNNKFEPLVVDGLSKSTTI